MPHQSFLLIVIFVDDLHEMLVADVSDAIPTNIGSAANAADGVDDLHRVAGLVRGEAHHLDYIHKVFVSHSLVLVFVY